jgi:hypothetical protein
MTGAYAWGLMPPKDEPTQRTEQGYEIPVPKRDDVLAVFDKAAQPIDKSKNWELAEPDEWGQIALTRTMRNGVVSVYDINSQDLVKEQS